MDIIRDLILTSNVNRSKLRIVNNNGTFGVVTTNETTPTLPTEISVTGASVMPTEISVVGASSGTIGTTDRVISFPYSGTGTTKDYTFTTTENLICDILMIGGGGAGGFDRAGGGGAGSCIIALSQTLGVGTYTIKVGSGQPVISNNTTSGTGGDSEIFLNSSILYRAKGGGNGGAAAVNNATAGGCGGGAGSQGPFNGGSATNLNYIAGNIVNANTTTTTYANLGFKGGDQLVGWNGSNGDQLDGAGGGGIGGAGVNHNVGEINGTVGGASLDRVVINTSTYIFKDYFAGGGTLGVNGFIGGGGGGGNCNAGVVGNGGGGGAGNGGGVSAISNTGSGGGGGAQGGGSGGAGGSGIVIIRYRKVPSEIVVSSTIAGTTDRLISFPYTGTGTTKDYTITTTEALSCDILVVGGGGAGGNSIGGGGGAGGVVYTVNQTLNVGTYTVKIGRGGIGTIHPGGDGQGTVGIDQDGQDSFIQLNSTDVMFPMGGVNQSLRGKGGGGGGVYYAAATVPGRAGGSGGGSGERENAVYNGGISTQGNTYWNGSSYVAGGSSGYGNLTTDGNYFAPGGGGAGNTQFNNIYNGKTGVEISITGTPQFYAAGGGGGQLYATGGTAIVYTTRGLGGSSIGGNGRIRDSASYTRDATSGANGTGSGGGGGAYNATPFLPAGSGGSGIIIIRYRKATNTVTNTIFSILNSGTIATSNNVYSNVIINVDTSSNISSTSNTGISGTWTTSSSLSANIYYNTSNVGIGTLDPVAPLHVYNNNTITTLASNISVVGATSGTISGTIDRIISFPYTTDSAGLTRQTQFTFTTNEALVCDILVVGGGGGGGDGGGGGGGYVYTSNLNIAIGTYIIRVGNGGLGGGAYTQGSQGASSSITGGLINIIAYGGGGGGGTGATAPSHTIGQVGSYGGNGADRAVVQTYTSTQGNRGGTAAVSSYGSGGGGGGAGGIGSDANIVVSGVFPGAGNSGTYYRGGTGGNGLLNTITGQNIYYAGGGTGGVNTNSGTDTTTQIAPIGGGGIGSRSHAAVGGNGIDGTGGGGGGGDPERSSVSARGGSGIVIIRYRAQPPISNSRLLLDTTTTGTPSIEFRRGVGADMQNDYRLINDSSPGNGTIKLLCENSTQSFGDTTANIMWFSSNETIIHKNTSMNGRVGIGTSYHATNATRSLDVLGDANISGRLSSSGLSISGNSSSGVSAIITNSLTSNTSLTIQNGLLASTYQEFTYTTETAGAGSGQTQYTLTVPTGGVVCDILVVGGGGGGARRMGGGGGAGALIYVTNQNLSAGTYTINVGNGGAGSATAGNIDTSSRLSIKRGSNGFDSEILFNSTAIFRAKGGGGGLGGNTGSVTNFPNEYSPLAGGSGGGNGGKDAGAGGLLTTLNIVNGSLVSVINNSASDSVNPSYVGGLCFGNEAGRGGGNDPWLGSGGGGAGSRSVDVHTLGNATANNFAGVGGIGLLNSITGTPVYYAGGGGGGNWDSSGGQFYNDGGLGGGGRSSTKTVAPIAGQSNTGGGGGGDGADIFGGAMGGSGIVIIRYLTSTSSSINLVRGTAGDANRDYKIGNYNAEFKVISSTSGVDTDYIKITTAGAITNPTGTASWNTGSDRRIKENIERASYDKCYENINRLELNRFNYINGFNTVSRDRAQLGFIAQEVKDIFPKSISTHEYYSDTLNIPDLLSIDISQINYSLYGAVKKLIEINKEDKAKLALLDNRIKTITNFLNISLDASDIVIDSSNIVIDSSNIAIDSSNIVIDSSNIVIDTSNIAIDTSNIMIDTSNIAIDTSNIAIDTSNIMIDTSNIMIDTSNIAIDTSNIAIDTSNIMIDTSNIMIDTSNISIE